jgi:spore coat protein U-like protein
MGICAESTKKGALGAWAAAALAAQPIPAFAQDNSLQIRADVARSCQLLAQPMMFGTIAVFFPAPVTQTSLFVECTPNTAYAVAIDNGRNPNGTQRRMIRIGPGFGTYLNYEIYRDAARTQRWGSTAGQLVSGVTPANGKVTLTAYARAQGFIVSGPFEDEVTITISF